jgi:hypothetical protein
MNNEYPKVIEIRNHTLTFTTQKRYEEFKLRLEYPLVKS